MKTIRENLKIIRAKVKEDLRTWEGKCYILVILLLIAAAIGNIWNEQTYCHMTITMPKANETVLKEHAASRNETVEEFVMRAIQEAMDRDKSVE